MCIACNLSKAKRRPTGAKHTTDDPSRADILSANNLLPGQCLSVDQYESSVRGRLPSTRGREPPQQQYCGGTLFIDHASGRMFIEHQVTLSASKTILSKRLVEQEARSCGIEIDQYHTDNGIFKSKAFDAELLDHRQGTDRSGVGAHHQNGRAERGIQTVQNMARTMLLHAALHWPDTADPSLWPYAMDHAVFLYNHTPSKDLGWLSPMEVFCSTRINCQYLR